MNKFEYRCKDQNGKNYSGLVEARDKSQAARVLLEKGLIITKLNQKTEGMLASTSLKFFNKVSFNDKVNFTRQLSTMINSGLPLTEALRILEDQTNAAMSKLINEVLNQVESGASLSKALEKHPQVFDRVYIALVRAGEEAGVLDTILNRLADNLEKQKEFGSKVKGALIYPAVVIIGMCAVALVMMIFVVPKLTSLYSEFNAELPLPTKILMQLSSLAVNFWWLGALAVVGVIILFPNLMKQRTFRLEFDRLLFKIPIFGKLRIKEMMADFARTLGLLVGAGVLVLDALNIVRDSTGSPIYEDAISQASDAVQKGFPLATALAQTGVFPTILPQMISVGEETGKTDEVLSKIANYFAQEAEQNVKNLTSALEPLIMVVLGAGVAFLVIAIIMPIYNLTSQF